MARELVHAARKDDVLKAMDTAVTKLRAELGESLSSIERLDAPIWQASTESFEALKAYSLGQKTFFERGDVDAIPLFQHAVELDPNFTRAYSALGVSYSNLHETRLSIENYHKAYELRDRVTERERLGIEASYYSIVTGELDKANLAYTLWAQAYPRDFTPHTNMGVNYSELGQYDKALAESLECLRLNPDDASCYINAVAYSIALNRLTDAERLSQQAMTRKLGFTYLHADLYALAFLKGDAGEMERQIHWAEGKAGEEDLFFSTQSDTEAFYGHFNKAREFSRRAVDSARQNDQREAAALWQMNLALREAEVGDSARARRDTAAALKLASTEDSQVLAALVLARSGDTARSETIANDLAKRFPLNAVINHYWLPTINALLAMNRSQPAKAVEILQATTPYELGEPEPSPENGGLLYPLYLRGQAYLALHRGNEAALEFQKILENRGVSLNCILGALAHLGLARANAVEVGSGRGVTADARARSLAAYRDFFALWKDADPNVSILNQAKAEYAKLQ
jgi:eukaryotic-like serine/threonine-protein kinase